MSESISLHRNEMPGGERKRALIEGRCHRDGEEAMIFYAYAEATVEEAIAATVTRRMASVEAMAGEDTSLLDEISAVLADHSAMR